jgi:hypothetical protein
LIGFVARLQGSEVANVIQLWKWGDKNETQGRPMAAIYPLIGLLIFLVSPDAYAGSGVPLTDDFWLLGDFTQNLPCKGDGSDPAEAKVKIASDQIVSKVGICKFLNAKLEGKRLKAAMECQFPAGPLVGDVTFTQKTNSTIDFVDRDNNYTATLHRCPR